MSLNVDILSSIQEKCVSQYKTDLCYEHNRETLAIGFNSGWELVRTKGDGISISKVLNRILLHRDVCLFSSKTYKFQHVIKDQPKSIMSLAWHPMGVLDSPEECSPFSNWLATAGEHVFVYDVDANGELDSFTWRHLCKSIIVCFFFSSFPNRRWKRAEKSSKFGTAH